MKNPTSIVKVVALSVGFLLAGLGHAQGVNTAASTGVVTIVQPIDVVAGKNPADVYKAMANIATAIRKMPGLVDDVVMENKNPSNKPSHVHVMRWKNQKSWEAMFSNPAFHKAIKENAGYFNIDAAAIYTPVK